jgi:hypothetical protein
MTTTFTSVKQVKAALWRNREILGRTPMLNAEQVDGGCGRIYQVWATREIGGNLCRGNILQGDWRDGAMSRRDLLAWANQTLTA